MMSLNRQGNAMKKANESINTDLAPLLSMTKDANAPRLQRDCVPGLIKLEIGVAMDTHALDEIELLIDLEAEIDTEQQRLEDEEQCAISVLFPQ